MFIENKDRKPTEFWTLIIYGFNFFTTYIFLLQKKEMLIEKFNQIGNMHCRH